MSRTISTLLAIVIPLAGLAYGWLCAGGYFRWESKNRIWFIGSVRWKLWPEVSCSSDRWIGSDTWNFWWLNLSIESLSKEWLQFSEDHGGGLEATADWILTEITDPSSGRTPTDSRNESSACRSLD